MGRRKIEIQPITHERNRSVTFLKRKNGLFKKAYELGVLCSVDVTVIIFEKAGTHNEKLYEYSSASDSDGQVSKRLEWDGERDARGPADFGGEKHPHPGLLVPSSGQDYDNGDGDGDGDSDGDSVDEVKEPKHKKNPPPPKTRRSSASDEVSSTTPAAARHPLAHAAPLTTSYLPTATLPVSDQRGSPHSRTPPTAPAAVAPHAPKRPRRESSGFPFPAPGVLHSQPAPLLGHAHPPPYYPQDDAYRALFPGVPTAQYPYAHQAAAAYRRPAPHLPSMQYGPAYHAPQYPTHAQAPAMFPGAQQSPFASLLAASGAGGAGFPLEWPVHNAQEPQRASPQGPAPPPAPAPAPAPPEQPPAPAPHTNGAGAARTKGQDESEPPAEDATSWLDYLAGIPARRDPPAASAPAAVGRDMDVDKGPRAEPSASPPGSEQDAPRNKRKHD